MRASLDTRSCSLAATAATHLVSVCIHPHPHTTSCLSVFLKKATPRPHSGVVTTSGAPSPRALLAPVQDSFDLCAWAGKRRMGMGWHTPVPSSSLSYWLAVSLAGNLVACGIHLTFPLPHVRRHSRDAVVACRRAEHSEAMSGDGVAVRLCGVRGRLSRGTGVEPAAMSRLIGHGTGRRRKKRTNADTA